MGDTVGVRAGFWNMIGVYEEDIPINLITTTPSDIVASYFFGFDNAYYIADTLRSGEGFWIRVTEDGRLNLNGGTLVKSKEQIAKTEQAWGRIKITDNEGNRMTLYATEEEINSNFYELQPMPPTGIFDARYSSGRLAENISSEQIIGRRHHYTFSY